MAAEQQRDGSDVGGGSLFKSVDESVESFGGSSAEAVAVSAAVLVDRSIGHLLPCRSSSV